MSNFELIAQGIDVAPLLGQLDRHPELWNVHSGRRRENSPHFDIPDIWVRFRAWGELTSPNDFDQPHFAAFYPAWDVLTALHAIVFDLMAETRATYLGGILITHIPPGKSVKPHADAGWHPSHHNLKIYVPIQSNPDCVNYCGGESVAMNAGEAWSFDNQVEHSVVNAGDTDRYTAIICLRTL